MEIVKRMGLLVLVFILAFSAANAQELFYRKNLANVRIDNLSQDQVIRFQRQVQSSNMTNQEMEAYLRSKGLSREEIAKLKKKMGRIGNTASANELYSIELMNDYFKLKDSLQGLDGQLEGLENQPYAKTKKTEEAEVFGAELFANAKMNFIPEVQPATPANYTIGPGDVLNFTLFGVQEFNAEIKVMAEGKVNLPYAGLISVAGLTIDQATRKIKGLFEKNGYASLATGESRLQITVAEFRTFHVTVIGAKSSGLFLVPSIAGAFHVLHLAGGPGKANTYREIEIIRKGKVIQQIDLYHFLLSGSLDQNITLQENDVINIPAYESRVKLKGEVKKTGLFELKAGENFNDLLRYAGGFTDLAYKERIYVEQVAENEFITRNIDKEGFESYVPQSGDVIEIGAITNRLINRVAIGGAVRRPGYFGWESNMPLSSLIEKAGGLNENALLTRGLIYRAKRDHSKAYLRFLPEDVINGTQQIVLEDGDSVVIADKSSLYPDEKVFVLGEVHNEGEFVFGAGITALDAVLLAGGFKKGALPNRIEIARRIDKTAELEIARVLEATSEKDLLLQAQEVLLQPGDKVLVRPDPNYKIPGVVRLEGEFKYPGPYVLLTQKEFLSDVIERAGGISELGDWKAAYIVRQRPHTVYLKRIKEFESKQLAKPIEGQSVVPEEYEMLGTSEEEEVDLLQQEEEVILDTIAIDLGAVIGRKAKKYNLQLRDGDVVFLPERRNTVMVMGEVNNRLMVNYTGQRIRPYLRDAGGLAKNADKRRVFVIEPGGRAKATKQFLGIRAYPRVVPGSVVVVPSKPPRTNDGLDPARLAAVSSVLGTTATVLIVITTLMR